MTHHISKPLRVGGRDWRALAVCALALMLPASAFADFATTVSGTARNGNGFFGTAVQDNFDAGGIGIALAFDSAATSAAVVEPFSNTNLGGSSSSASANISTGELKAHAATRGVLTLASGYVANTASANASLRDFVRVAGDIPDGSFVQFIIDYHGFVDGDRTVSQLGDISTSTSGSLTFTAQAPNGVGSTRSLRHMLVDGSCALFSSATQGCTSGKSIDQQFLVSVPISNTSRNVFFDFGISAVALGEGAANFGNTAALGLVLPQGLSFTSDSGVLLTAVPLPPSWPMLMLGVSAVLVARRRYRQA